MSAKKNLLFCAFFFCLLPLAKANIVDSLGLKKESSKTYIVYKMGNKQPVLSVLKRYNLSLAEFKQANPETDIPVKSGEIVFIPLHYMDESTAVLIQSSKPAAIPVSAMATEKKADEKKVDDEGIHIVTAKQSLLSVANLHKVTMAEIRKWNNLTSDMLKEGQRLWVSAPKTTVIDKATLLPSKNPTEEIKSTEIVAPKEGTNPEGLKKTIETGIAELIDVPDNSGKYLALHKSAPIGTLVLVKNLANNQSIWVKVIGRLPNADSKLIIKLSPKAFERLNAVDKRIRAEISYLVQ
jgi:LysM repeat protein